MKLIDQVCTERQADRLKELGVAQGSLFYHTHSDKWGVMPRKSIDFSGDPSSAFTVAELGVMLPYRMRDEEKRENPHLRIYRGENEWHVEYHQVFSRPYIRSYAYENLSDAMAHVLIHLLENKLITPEEVNARLCAE